MKNFEKLSVTITRKNITNPDRIFDYWEEINVTDGKRTANFIQHGENTLDKYKFHGGTTANGIKLWTRHDMNFKTDLNFIKEPNRWEKNQDKMTEVADMINFIQKCHELPIVHISYEGNVTYDVINGKTENIMTDKTKNLFRLAYEAMTRHETAQREGFPVYYIDRLKEEADRFYNEIKAENMEKRFFDVVSNF